MKIFVFLLFVFIASNSAGSIFDQIPLDFPLHSRTPVGSVHRTTYSEVLPYEFLAILAMEENYRLEAVILNFGKRDYSDLEKGVIRVLQASLSQDIQVEILRENESATQFLICTYVMHRKGESSVVAGWENYKRMNKTIIQNILNGAD